MARQFRVGTVERFGNMVMGSLLRLGVPIGKFRLLVVRGRVSGRPIETPLALFEYGGQRHLLAAYGTVNWVRNLRAADGQAMLRCGHTLEHVHAVELPPADAALVYQAALQAGPPGIPKPLVAVYRERMVLPYLDVNQDSPLADFERQVVTHPVFAVQSR